MNTFIRKLNDPNVLVKFHAGMTILWIALIAPTLIWFPDSILWLAIMSLWANIASHWAAAQASHAERSEQSGLDNEDLDKKLDRVIALLEQQKPPEAERCL